MSAEEQTISKSARKRANQKARAAEAAAEAAPPAPAPAPKPEPKAKAKAEAKAEPKAKAKAEPKAEPKAKAKADAKAKAEPKAEGSAKAKAKAEPKAEAKAKAKADPKAKAEPEPKAKAKAKAAESAPAAPAEPKAKAKAEGKAKAKSASAKAKAPEPPKEEPKVEVDPFVQFDDGKGGDWEVSTGLSKKQQKRKEKKEEEEKELKQMQKQLKETGKVGANQYIPGYVSPEQLLKDEKMNAKKQVDKLIAEARAAGAAVKQSKDAEIAAAGKEKEAAAAQSTATIKVPSEKVARIIGPKGSNINLIKEKTGVTTIDTQGDVCVIIGPEKSVTLAEHAIRELMEKGYMSLAFEDFEEAGVQVHPSVFPNLIGEKGVVIQKIKSEAKVEIDIPQGIPKEASNKPKKYKVAIAGSKAGVEKAKEIINSIAMYSYHEVTHPGMTHCEMEVEPWRYSYLIGKGGSELRHIQNNYKVKVNIPREFSAVQNVVIMGEPRDVERAKAYIEKIMYEADQPKGRGAADKADDGWGDEEAVEDWMTPYMYNRKK